MSVCAGCVTATLSSPSRTPARSTAAPSVSATTTHATTSRDNSVEVGVTRNNILTVFNLVDEHLFTSFD